MVFLKLFRRCAKKSATLVALVSLFFYSFVYQIPVVYAAITEFDGEITTTGTFQRPKWPYDVQPLSNLDYIKVYQGDEAVGLKSGTYYYFTRNLIPSETGNYTLEVDSVKTQIPDTGNEDPNDTHMLLYAGSFNPANPLANLLYANEDKYQTEAGDEYDLASRLPNIPLTAGQTYVLVVTTNLPGLAGPVFMKIDGAGPVTVKPNAYSFDVPPDTTAPTITGKMLGVGNSYVDVAFSEPVYSASNGTGALTKDSFALLFNQNGGGVTNVTISSATKTDGNPLVGGETTVRLHLTVTGTPTGVETIEIKPANDTSIYDEAGNAALATESTGLVTLKEMVPPTITGKTLGGGNSYVDVTFSEPVYSASNGTGALTKDSFALLFNQNGGSATNVTISSATKTDNSPLAGGETTVRLHLTVTGTPTGVETIEIKPANDTSIYDEAGNAALATESTGLVTLKEMVPPTITGKTLGGGNSYVDVTFSEPVYSASNGTGALTKDSFALLFNQNGGGATNVTISSATKTDGSALAGGETTVRLHLTVTGTPTGVETIEIKPVNGTAIFDAAGNAALVTTTTGTITLADQSTPTITGKTLASDNSYVDVTFSHGVYSASNGTGALTKDSFALLFNQNGGGATNVTISSATKTDGNPLVGGETTVRLHLTVTGTPTGVETIELKPASATSIYSVSGNAALVTTTTGTITLADQLAPKIADAKLGSGNSYVDVTFSEPVYSASNGTGALTKDSFALLFNQNGGNATNVTISSATKTDGSPLAGGETTVRLHLTVTGTPTGVETIEIKPANDTSIYDEAGNAALATESTGLVTLKEMVPPTITGKTLGGGNSYVDVTFSEPVYSASNGTGALTKDSFALLFNQNGGGATNVTISSATRTDGSALAGGETTVRLHLTVTGTPTGVETIEIKPANDTSIYDEAGNAALATESTGLVTLKEMVPPTITGKTLGGGNSYVDVTFSEPVYSASNGTGALTKDSFALLFNQNGGGATNVTISSATKTDGSPLAGGETTVRLHLTVTGTPTGVETIEIKPANGTSIYDAAGNAALATETTGTITLADQAAPTITGKTLGGGNSYVDVTFSEPVYSASNGTGALTKDSFALLFNQNGGGATNVTINSATKTDGSALAGGETTVRLHLTVTGTPTGVETIEVKPANGTSIYDAAGNAAQTTTTTGTITLADQLAPKIADAKLGGGNGYVDVTFSEPVYSASNGTGALTKFSFTLSFNQNGGSATNVTINNATKTDGNPLVGGETTVRLHLTLTGMPSGVEEIEIKPANGTSIYDAAGNPASSSENTGKLTLTEMVPPTMTGAVRISDTQLAVTFSEPVTGINKMNDGGFAVTEKGAGGINYPVTAIAQGSAPNEVLLTVADVGVSGKESLTITYSAGGNGTIADLVGNAMLTDATGVEIAAWDTTAPFIADAIVHSRNEYIDVTFSEGVYANDNGTGAVEADDFLLTLVASGGATAVDIRGIGKNDGKTLDAASPLTGGETVIRFFLAVTGTASGSEKIVIQPASGTSLYDKAGNAMDVSATTGEKNLADRRPPSSSSPTGGTVVSPNVGFAVIVDGEVQESTATAIITTENNRKVTTIIVDETKLKDKLASVRNGYELVIPVSNGSDTVISELNAHLVKNMENKAAVLKVVTETATYTLPAAQIHVDAVSESIGKDVPLEDIKIRIEMNVLQKEQIRPDETGNIRVIAPLVEFNITAIYGDKSVTVERFNAYVQISIAIPEGVDPGKITTGVVVQSDGTHRHVPTSVQQSGGTYYAIINSLTNSIYTVIYNEKSFGDIKGHWAKRTIENMASRLVVSGVSPDRFNPDAEITRAEFAAIIVNALGLYWTDRSHAFHDVVRNAWYEEAVQIAATYGLVSGYADGTFRPDQPITRQEAMVIIARAMSLTSLQSKLTSSEASALVSRFADSGDFAGWAVEAAALNIKHGIISGFNGKVNPLQLITRAETAIVAEKLLKKSGLINE